MGMALVRGWKGEDVKGVVGSEAAGRARAGLSSILPRIAKHG